jgi:hypothetical protein
MKNHPSINRRHPILWIGWIWISLLIAPTVSAQTIYTEKTATKLRTMMHLRPGTTTLAKVMEALTQQTGMPITAQSCLQERKIIVQMDNMSARDVLDTFSELYGWRWTEIDKGGILLMRPRPKNPQTVEEISLAAQAALPRDIRRFLGIGIPVSDLTVPDNPKIKETIEFLKRSPVPSAKDDIVKALVSPKLGGIFETKAQFLYSSLLPGVEEGKVIYYTQLAPPQRDALMIALALSAMQNFNHEGYRILHGTIRSDLLDIAIEEIFLHNGDELVIGKSSFYQGGRLFQGSGGGTIKSLPHIEPTRQSPP